MPNGALVIMDAGLATDANLRWLVAQGYRHLAVRHAGARQFELAQAIDSWTAGGKTVCASRRFVFALQ